MAEEGREGRKKGRKGGCHLLFNKYLFHRNYCHLEFFMVFHAYYLEVKPCCYPSLIPITVEQKQSGRVGTRQIGVLFPWFSSWFLLLKCRLSQVKTCDEGYLGRIYTPAQDVAKAHLLLSKIS